MRWPLAVLTVPANNPGAVLLISTMVWLLWTCCGPRDSRDDKDNNGKGREARKEAARARSGPGDTIAAAPSTSEHASGRLSVVKTPPRARPETPDNPAGAYMYYDENGRIQITGGLPV
jgi:hypothetical protein